MWIEDNFLSNEEIGLQSSIHTPVTPSSQSDVWSLGCVVYEMCTMKHAFKARDFSGLALKICRGQVRSLFVLRTENYHLMYFKIRGAMFVEHFEVF